jgi:hypothetical protein
VTALSWVFAVKSHDDNKKFDLFIKIQIYALRVLRAMIMRVCELFQKTGHLENSPSPCPLVLLSGYERCS